MRLKELFYEAEDDENNGVKWKHSRLKAKLVEYMHYMYHIMLQVQLEKK